MRKSGSSCVSISKASRRFFHYRIREAWSRVRRVAWLPDPRGPRFVVIFLSRKRAGTQILYEDCMRGEMENRERQPFRRPNVDSACQCLCFADFSSGRGGSDNRPRPGTAGPSRNGRRGCRPYLRAQGSALVSFDLEGAVRLEGSASVPTQCRPKAGAMGVVCLRSLRRGVEAVRRSSSFFAMENRLILPSGRGCRSFQKPRWQPGFGLRFRWELTKCRCRLPVRMNGRRPAKRFCMLRYW